MEAINFLKLVAEMRAEQRKYLTERSSSSLKKARQLEKRVDQAMSIIIDELTTGKIKQLTFNFE